MSKPKISVLVSARKNSKYLAKFLFGYFERTNDFENTELLVMLNDKDTWNVELMTFFMATDLNIRFFTEDLRLGRGGLHEYLNCLLEEATGDWVIYFCEDHFITMPAWDDHVRAKIVEKELDPKDVWCLIPKFDNVGAMNQILSAGYIKALGNSLGRHGNIDSYINDVNREAFGIDHKRAKNAKDDRVVRFDDEMFHDFTHDQPSPLDDVHTKTKLSREAYLLPEYDTVMVRRWIKQDAEKIRRAL